MELSVWDEECIRRMRRQGMSARLIAARTSIPLEIVGPVVDWDRAVVTGLGAGGSRESYWFGETQAEPGEAFVCKRCRSKVTAILPDGCCRACRTRDAVEAGVAGVAEEVFA